MEETVSGTVVVAIAAVVVFVVTVTIRPPLQALCLSAECREENRR